MKITLLSFLIFTCGLSFAQVGIGTTSPSPNAALDVTSTNKGFLLPRLADTTNVANPSAGLMIYDLQSEAPAFHDGVKWNRVSTSSAQMTNNDSITYTISNPARMLGFVAGTYPLTSVSLTGINPGAPPTEMSGLSISKHIDVNSIPYKRATLMSSNMTSMIIEFKIYHPGDPLPYYSVKLTNIEVFTFSAGASTGNLMIEENYIVVGRIVGFKDWVNGQSFGWNQDTQSAVAY